VRVTGAAGVVRYGYHSVSTLGAWTVVPLGQGRFRIEAKVLTTNAVWIDSRPVDVCLSLGHKWWVWSGVHPGELIQDGSMQLDIDCAPTIVNDSAIP
jgi:hypothetical protein